MLWTIAAFVAGTFVGWSFPQPQWAADFVAWIKSKFGGTSAPTKAKRK